MFELFNPKWRVPFIRMSRVTLVASALAIVGSLVLLVRPGLDFALDFTGGTALELHFEQPADLAGIRALLAEQEIQGAQVQTFGSAHEVLIRLPPEAAEASDEAGAEADAAATSTDDAAAADAGALHRATIAERVVAALAEQGTPAEIRRNETVGPQIGAEMAEDGIVGLVFVMFGIMVYVAFRYEWRFGIAAIAGEFHDVVITAGILVLIGQEFDLQALAALLTVAGYSINDKVVIFDRIREMFRTTARLTPAETIDLACSDTLSRTVITGVTTLMALTVLFFLGGEALKGFSLTLIIGILIGTYSSVLFASPLLLHLGVTKQDLMPKMRDETELARRP